MSRAGLTASAIVEATATEHTIAVLLKFAFDSGDLNLWTGLGDVTWNGDVYTGASDLLGIEALTETKQVEARGVKFALSGIPSSIISTALGQNYQGRSAKMWLAFLVSDSIVADPYLLFNGRMDVMTIEDLGDTATIAVSAENVLVDLERPAKRRYQPEDQEADYPGDKGFEFVAGLQVKDFPFGVRSS